MPKKYLKLNDIESYRESYALSNYVWNIVIRWDFFSKDTVGKQFVRSIDSISANIAEGFGRYNAKDKIRFYKYAKGSALESLDWNQKGKSRGIIKEEKYNLISEKLNALPKMINSLIKFTRENLKE